MRDRHTLLFAKLAQLSPFLGPTISQRVGANLVTAIPRPRHDRLGAAKYKGNKMNLVKMRVGSG